MYRGTNPIYHVLLQRFRDLTGCPVIVNTSFNVRGEPIVCTPEDAFGCFMGTDIERLVVGHAMLSKEQQNPALRQDYKNAFALDRYAAQGRWRELLPRPRGAASRAGGKLRKGKRFGCLVARPASRWFCGKADAACCQLRHGHGRNFAIGRASIRRLAIAWLALSTAPAGGLMPIPTGLAAGYRRFRSERYAAEAERYRALAKGQRPRTMIIACADSRADPATIFSAAPGELFVVRNVAALVPPFEEGGGYHGTSAAIEFAVSELAVPEIVVMGHGLCGGIAAALSERSTGRFIGPWVELLAGIRAQLADATQTPDAAARQKRFEQLAVQYSLQNLTSFPFVAAAVAAGRLHLHGAWFAIAEGELEWLDGASGRFELVRS